MDNRKNKKVKMKYMNEFPLVIIIAIVAIVIVIFSLYLNIKPHSTINKNGYMVLANNMTYNLITENKENEDLEVGVTYVAPGEYLYKQMGTYYVGVEKKKEIDYDYPLYSSDGLTIYNQNENAILIDRNFQKLKGYSGLSLNYGILYNDGDIEPADDVDYLFLYLNNSIYINAQTIVVKTLENEYTIPMHSPSYFDTKYINYYIFDGKKFNYNTINDIYYDSLIKIGDVTLTYYEFLIQMGLTEQESYANDNEKEEVKEEEKNEDNNQIEQLPNEEIKYVKPIVEIEKFNSNVYSINSKITIVDPSNVIEMKPTFEVYTAEDKLYSRKKATLTGDVTILGLSANTKYKIVGSFSYKNESGILMTSVFYEDEITTRDIEDLDAIDIYHVLGDMHSNSIQLRDVFITKLETEAVNGIKSVIVNFKKEKSSNSQKINLSYSQIQNLIKGEKIRVDLSSNIESNSVYEYWIEIFDQDGNELPLTGNVRGTAKTSKMDPKVKISSNIDRAYNTVDIKIETQNDDNLYIKDYEYSLYTYYGYLISRGELDFENKSIKELHFEDLDYNTNYILKINGLYDLEDGKGTKELNVESDFTTANLKSNFTAWYDKNTLDVTTKTISADVYIGSNTVVLEKNTTEVLVYLTDENGEDILDEKGELKYCNKYTKKDYSDPESVSYHMHSVFENLESGTKYNIKVKINVKQLEKNISLVKTLTPIIETPLENAYMNVITKKLIGNDLDVKLKIVDSDNLINDESVIVEIYKGKLSSTSDISERYVYRNSYDISQSNQIELRLTGYNEENYTVFVSANPYNGMNVKKYLASRNMDNENAEAINLDREIESKLEMYSQLNFAGETNKLDTKISFNVDMKETTANIYFADCIDGVCTNLGYRDINYNFVSLNEKTKDNTPEFEINPDDNNKKILSIKNDKTSNQSDHTFYILVEKANVDLSGVTTFNETLINSNIYALDYLEYSTNDQIHNINSAEDFFDARLIKTSGETRKYVVTNNIDFVGTNKITGYRFYGFNGVIDFQGYSVDLYRDNESKLHLFNAIEKKGVLKNIVINYHLNHDGVIADPLGFIYVNRGTVENVIVNVEQKYTSGRTNGTGLLAQSNFGLINNFVVYLNTDIHMYSSAFLISKQNNSSGIISNGYVTTNPYLNETKRIILHDPSTTSGTFAFYNYGTLKNVYNLVSVVSAEDAYKGGIGSIVYSNNVNGTIKNSVSVATTTQTGAAPKGQNIYSNAGKSINNYYVDTNLNNVNYASTYNKKIDLATLMNSSFWEIVLNNENEFSVMLGYFPTLKMNNFMSGKQEPIKIAYDHYNETKIDVLSTETLSNNINGLAQIKVYISNPNKYTVTDVTIQDLTSFVSNIIYDESLQASIVTLDLSLGKNDIAKSSYAIASLSYLDNLGGEHTKNYSDNNLRRIDIDMYRKINEYDNFVVSINKNENIYLVDSFVAPKENFKIPEKRIYTAILNGNEKSVDFNENTLTGYYISNFNGIMTNVQFKNLNIDSADFTTVGLISTSNSATFENIDLNNFNIEIKRTDGKNRDLMLAGLVASSSDCNFNRISVNDIKIIKSDESKGKIINSYIGGMLGFVSSSTLSNSYVYNLDFKNIYLDNDYGYEAIGGVSAYLVSGTSMNLYSMGTIETDYSNVGGIAGKSNIEIRNTYSYVEILSSGDYVGGIVGKTGTTVRNSMFIGSIKNKSFNENYSQITPAKVNASYNYALVSENKFISVEEIIDKNNFIDLFDKESVFIEDNIKELDLPYLKESSFVSQKVREETFENFLDDDIVYSIESSNGYDCVVPQIKDVNNENNMLSSNLYQSACRTSAILRFLDSGYKVVSSDDLNVTEKADARYEISPKNTYKNYYNVIVEKDGKQETLEIRVPFYRTVSNQEEWNKISDTEYENIILMNDIELNENALKNKKISNLLGNGYLIEYNSDASLNRSLINKITGNMRDVSFSGFNISFGTTSEASLINSNVGIISNCGFYSITIKSNNDKSAIIAYNSGTVDNVKLRDISVTGGMYVASLVAYDSSDNTSATRILNVNADNIKLYGRSYVGGIAGSVQYLMRDINVSNLEINSVKNDSGKVIWYPTERISGIVGLGNCTHNCNLMDSKIYASGNYISGIQNRRYGYSVYNSSVKNVIISDYIDGVGTSPKKSRNVGGMISNGSLADSCFVDNLVIGNIKLNENNEEVITPINGEEIGGVGDYIYYSSEKLKVNNSYISGTNYVGGLFGKSESSISVYQNVLSNSTVFSSSGKDVGGIIGKLSGNPYVYNNMVINSSLSGVEDVGGIIGNLNNDTNASQQTEFYGNSVLATTVEATNGKAGGLIGRMKQVPAFESIKFYDSIFYGDVLTGEECGDCSVVGQIDDLYTGSMSGYGQSVTKEEFIIKSNFAEYISSEEKQYDYQINSYDSLTNYITSAYVFPPVVGNIKYFQVLSATGYDGENIVKETEYVEVPYDSLDGSHQSSAVATFGAKRMFRNYSSSYNNKLEIEYDVYASSVSTINIDFNKIDSDVYFYYEIGEYKSSYIPITKRTYTLTYDFKTPIKIYVSNNFNNKTSTIKPDELTRTVSLVGGETYYINNNSLYNSSKMISGKFVNLYKDEALTYTGQIYNIISKQETDAYITYDILLEEKPLYETLYNGTDIKTFYNYSTVKGIEREMQLFVNNGNLSSISGTLDNKKTMYIIDYYNDDEIQIVLRNDGKLYSLMNNIKYPNDIYNENIAEIYTDINSSNNMVALKYTNGAVYTFNYRTGEIVFSNISKGDVSLLEYIKDKLNSASKNDMIESISSEDKYNEKQLLKRKLVETSLDEASDKIYNTNNALSNSENYITVYNEITKDYDIYKQSLVIDGSLELESETNKLYKNYDLIKFYKNIGKNSSKKSVNGIIIFSISIITILISLALLIRHKVNKGVASYEED